MLISPFKVNTIRDTNHKNDLVRLMTLNHLTHCAENSVSLNPQPFKTKNGKKNGDRWWCSALMIPCCTSWRVTAEIEKWQFQVNSSSGCVLLNELGCTPHEHQARRLSIGFIMLMRAQQRYLYLLTCVFFRSNAFARPKSIGCNKKNHINHQVNNR